MILGSFLILVSQITINVQCFLLTLVCCSPCLCSGFLHHRTWNKHCKDPKDPTRRELAAGPTLCSHTFHVCNTKWEWTQQKKQRQRLRKWKKTWKKKRNDCNTCVLLTGVTELDCRSKACTAGSVVHICLLNPYFRSKATILKKSRSSLLFALRECVQLLQLSKE